MAQEKTQGQQEQLSLEENVFLRLLKLPIVSCTCEVIERTYSGTKEAHPLVSSVCEASEHGMRAAGNLAVRGMRPAMDKLEPQLTAANSLVCRGLDHLEERIPALQYSPEKLATEISEAVSSTVQIAKDGITRPMLRASDAVVSLTSGGLVVTRSALSEGSLYVLNSRPVRLAEEGASSALTAAERLVNYILPPFPDEAGVEKEGVMLKEQQSGGVSSPGSEPSLRRLGALVNTVCQRAYTQTTVKLQHTRSQGQDLVARIPGVASLAGYAKQNLEAVSSNILGLPAAVAGFFEEPQQSRQGVTQNRTGEAVKSGSRVQELVSSAGQQLQSAYVSIVSGAKNAPKTTVGLAKDGTDLVLESLSSAKKRFFTIFHHGLFSSHEVKQNTRTGSAEEEVGKSTSCVIPQQAQNGSGHPDTQSSSKSMEPQVSEETRLLRKRVLQEIPIQQRVILSGSHRSLTPRSSKDMGEGQTDLTMTTHTRVSIVIKE